MGMFMNIFTGRIILLLLALVAHSGTAGTGRLPVLLLQHQRLRGGCGAGTGYTGLADEELMDEPRSAAQLWCVALSWVDEVAPPWCGHTRGRGARATPPGPYQRAAACARATE
jgi:hypothetical protein